MLPDPASSGGESADAIAFLDQGQPEVVGLDGQVSELYQAHVETCHGVAPEIAEQDLTVRRGGEPAGGGTENTANASQIRALALLLAFCVEELQAMRTCEQGDCGRVFNDGDDRGLGLLFGLNDGDEPVRAAHRAGCTAGHLARGCGGPREPTSRAALLATEEVEPDNLAGRMAIDEVSAKRIDFQRHDRARQPGAPAYVSR